MYFQLLAFWHRFSIQAIQVWNNSLSAVRDYVGPAPVNYYLLQDGRVIPTSISLPDSITPSTFIYDVSTHRITSCITDDANPRYRRLPYIAANFNHPSVGNVDISDWLGEIRAYPVPDIHFKQLLQLWSLVHHSYVPLSDGVQVTVTKNDGETDLITFD